MLKIYKIMKIMKSIILRNNRRPCCLIARFIMLIVLSMGMGCLDKATNEERLLSAYQMDENQLAEKRGYGVCVRVYADKLRWNGAFLGQCEFVKQLKDDLSRERLSDEELSRAPFSILVCDDVPYGRVFELLEIGRSLGFLVKSAIYTGPVSKQSETKSKNQHRSLLLPRLGRGACDDIKRNSINILMHLNGVVEVGEQRIQKSDGLDKRVSWAMQNSVDIKDKEVVLMIDKEVSFSCVNQLLDGVSAAGKFRVSLAGINSSDEMQCLCVGIPAPDGFYWAWSDDDACY